MRVAIIDDHPITLDGLSGVVGALDDVHVAATAGSIEDFDLHAAEIPGPDVVILDLHLPGITGADAVAHVRRTGAVVLVMSHSEAQDDVLAAVDAGAAGYLSKRAQPTELADALQTVNAGGTYVTPTLADYLLRDSAETPDDSEFALTAREHDVLELLSAGERDVDIASELHISINTVRSHLERIREKTGRRRRAELAHLAYELGIGRADGREP